MGEADERQADTDGFSGGGTEETSRPGRRAVSEGETAAAPASQDGSGQVGPNKSGPNKGGPNKGGPDNGGPSQSGPGDGGPGESGTFPGDSGYDKVVLDSRTLTLPPRPEPGLPLSTLARDLKAEAITIRVRWFGILVGLCIVNGPLLLGETPGVQASGISGGGRLLILNGILLFGAVFATIDTLWSRRGRVFLGDVPLFVSLMEAVFIGLLCYFHSGAGSAFRVYYFLSLLIAAIRYRSAVTWTTLGLHAGSYLCVLVMSPGPSWSGGLLTLVLMAWVTWACESLSRLLRRRSAALRQANAELRENQALLERRIAERTAELQESQGLLVQHEKQAAFGLLAAGIAHEVGNPLAAISSLVQLLKRRSHEEYTSQRLDTIDTQIQRIQRTLREMISFSRPASRRRMRIDVREACEAAVSIAKYYKRRKGKTVRTDYAELPPVDTVHDQLVQIVLNLVLNAMDATDEGGVIEVSTRLHTRPSGRDEVVIRVRDDGEGIPASRRAEIFEPYVTSKPEGTGLGLFVCRNLARQLGGDLALEEATGDGATFAVRIPAGDERGRGGEEESGS